MTRLQKLNEAIAIIDGAKERLRNLGLSKSDMAKLQDKRIDAAVALGILQIAIERLNTKRGAK